REMPVIFHVADPPEFWEPEVGELSLFGKSVPAFKELVQGAARLCAKAPDTTIVFPHLLFLAADLPGAGAFLDQSPNACFDLAPGNYFYLPLSDNLSSARDFFSRYRKRILFGSDAFFFSDKQAPIPGDSLKGNRRRCHRLLNFLQKGAGEEDTEDNPYPLTRDIRSSVRCLNLPEDLQESILSGNALRILPDTPAEVHR
ncbi:MAG: amidohydrolase family protein, partial [Spirochaetaceae bacterium]|nr:amidohydrolase family protein [Spirochaetaceae bacterium]